MMSYKKWVLICLTATGLCACGGGGGSDNGQSQIETPPDPNLETGRLQGASVEGLRYTTESHSGLTNSRGEYHYIEGETITFSVGGTQFPITPATSELNLFSIIGINPLLQETEIVNALNADDASSFDTAINMSNLLQTLDADGNPGNGIALGNADARLQAVTIPLQVKAIEFSLQPELARAKTLHSVSHNRTLPQVMDFLYQDLHLSVESAQPARQIRTTEGRSNTLAYEYDNNGLIRSLGQDIDNNGTIDVEESFTYDVSGNITTISNSAEKTSQLLSYDPSGNLLQRETQRDGRLLRSESFSFMADRIQSFECSASEEGESSTVDYEYDNHNRLSGYLIDIDGEEASDIRSTFHYDDDQVAQIDEDRNNDGTVDLSIHYTYLNDGKVQTQRTIETIDGARVEILSRFFYDSNNNTTRYEEDRNSDGQTDYVEDYQYDEHQQRTQYRKDLNADNRWDSTAHYTYDLNGNLIRMMEDSNGDNFADVYWEAQIESVTRETPNWQSILERVQDGSS